MKSYTSNPRGIKPEVRGQIIPAQGAPISFQDEDVDGNSISIITGTSNPGEFTVGAAVMGQLTFTLLNGSGAFSNVEWYDSKVAFHLFVGNDDFDMGTFYVVDHKESGYNVTITCYDALKVMDEYQLYEDKQDSTTPLTFPTTVANAISNIAGHRNLTVTGLPAIASNITIADPNDDYMSERSFISYCAQLCGVYVTAYKSQLRFAWYDMNTTPYDMGVTFSHDLRTNDITITGVKVVTADGNQTQVRGTTGYQLEIEDNPLITADNINTVIGYIYSAVNGITYRPGTVEIIGTPALEAGDIIEVETAQESGIIMIASTINYGTDLTISITADCEPYAGDLRINRSRYIKKMAKQAVAEELADVNSDLSQAIEQAAGGGGGETITLPGVRVICEKDASDNEILGHYDGFAVEFDQWQQTGAIWTNRQIAGRSTTAIGTLAGIEIKDVTYPEQKIKVPENDGESGYVDLLVTRIKSPTLTEYRAVYGSSVSTSQRKARVCEFGVTIASPYKVTVKVTRAKGVSSGTPYDRVVFEAIGTDPNPGVTSRPTATFSGFARRPIAASYSGNEPYTYRIPVSQIPLPGAIYDILLGKWYQMDAYCDYVDLYPL